MHVRGHVISVDKTSGRKHDLNSVLSQQYDQDCFPYHVLLLFFRM